MLCTIEPPSASRTWPEQRQRILRASGVLGERLGDRADVAHRHAIDEQLLHDLDDDAERQRARRQVFDELRRGLREAIEQVLDFLVAEQLMRVALQELAQVRRDDGRGVDDRESERLRVLLRGGLDPVRVEAERGVLRADADDLRRDAARIDREIALGLNLAFADRHAENRDPITRSASARGCRECARTEPGSRAPPTTCGARP